MIFHCFYYILDLVDCRQEAVILDGLKIAEEIQEELKVVVDTCINAGKKRPKLVAILVGNHPPSKAYVGRKMKAAKLIGNSVFHSQQIDSFCYKIPALIFFVNRQELKATPFIWEKI